MRSESEVQRRNDEHVQCCRRQIWATAAIGGVTGVYIVELIEIRKGVVKGGFERFHGDVSVASVSLPSTRYEPRRSGTLDARAYSFQRNSDPC
jgi:hypothetical protein